MTVETGVMSMDKTSQALSAKTTSASKKVGSVMVATIAEIGVMNTVGMQLVIRAVTVESALRKNGYVMVIMTAEIGPMSIDTNAQHHEDAMDKMGGAVRRIHHAVPMKVTATLTAIARVVWSAVTITVLGDKGTTAAGYLLVLLQLTRPRPSSLKDNG